MARTTDVMTLSGMDGFKRALAQSRDGTIAGVERVIATSTFAVTGRVEAWARRHKRTGRLLGAVSGKANKLSGRVTIDAGAFYWRFIENGTIRIPADPGVRTAVEAEAEGFAQGLRRVERDVERDFNSGRLA